jgi:hypothetical protein
MTAKGPEGLPFFGDDNPYASSAKELDLLARVMTEEVHFFRMTPQDSLLSGHDSKAVWCLAEPSKQYLIFATQGAPFTLHIAVGNYARNTWIDAKTGEVKTHPALTVDVQQARQFTPPNTATDWVLLLR